MKAVGAITVEQGRALVRMLFFMMVVAAVAAAALIDMISNVAQRLVKFILALQDKLERRERVGACRSMYYPGLCS